MKLNQSKIKSGIYKIKNLVNNKCYIGSSINIRERWNRHKKDLRKNRHHSKYLQMAWNKYGENNFKFMVIKFCIKKENLLNLENYYFQKFRPKYNINQKAESPLGRKLTDEEKQKHRENAIRLGIKPPPPIKKPILMIDKVTNDTIRRFDSITEACNYVGKTHHFVSCLRECCFGKRKTAFGYKWKYPDENENRKDSRVIKK